MNADIKSIAVKRNGPQRSACARLRFFGQHPLLLAGFPPKNPMDIRRGKSTKLTGYPHIHCSDFNSDPFRSKEGIIPNELELEFY